MSPFIFDPSNTTILPGPLLREYLDSPVRLPPMSTLEYIVGARDKVGGSGANFVVEWMSDRKVTKPVIECVVDFYRRSTGDLFRHTGSESRLTCFPL